jgi:hydroxypyruvate isomerase
MIKYSANLGFLWRDLPLADAIFAAKAAGFDAVECHWPYANPAEEIGLALRQAGLSMLVINTAPGNQEAGDFGLAAIAGRTLEARRAIAQAVDYAHHIKAASVHVMAGKAEGEQAHHTFIDNLQYACEISAMHDISILIEPLNRHDVPGYFLGNTQQAKDIITAVDRPNLRLMFDCYHVARTEGDVVGRLAHLIDVIGHIQFASVPDRGPPDKGDLDYRILFLALEKMGWSAPLGAEYRPPAETEASLGWMTGLQI